jgi:hypothetical protein
MRNRMPVRRRIAGLLLALALAMSAQCLALCAAGIHCAAAPQVSHTHCHRHGQQQNGGMSTCAHQQPFATASAAHPAAPPVAMALLARAADPRPTGYVALAPAVSDTGPPWLTVCSSSILRV